MNKSKCEGSLWKAWDLRGYWRSLPFSALMAFTVRLNGLLYVEGLAPVVYRGGSINIGRRFLVRGFHCRSEIGAVKHGELTIGNNVFVNQGCSIVAHHRISIGDDCLIGDFSTILDTSHHELAPGLGIQTEPVEIGNNVWIGRNCVVLPGVQIGNNSVVAAGSIVTRDVPENHLVAGNPAKFVRELPFEEGWVRR